MEFGTTDPTEAAPPPSTNEHTLADPGHLSHHQQQQDGGSPPLQPPPGYEALDVYPPPEPEPEPVPAAASAAEAEAGPAAGEPAHHGAPPEHPDAQVKQEVKEEGDAQQHAAAEVGPVPSAASAAETRRSRRWGPATADPPASSATPVKEEENGGAGNGADGTEAAAARKRQRWGAAAVGSENATPPPEDGGAGDENLTEEEREARRKQKKSRWEESNVAALVVSAPTGTLVAKLPKALVLSGGIQVRVEYGAELGALVQAAEPDPKTTSGDRVAGPGSGRGRLGRVL